jgi:hypothetical protein
MNIAHSVEIVAAAARHPEGSDRSLARPLTASRQHPALLHQRRLAGLHLDQVVEPGGIVALALGQLQLRAAADVGEQH